MPTAVPTEQAPPPPPAGPLSGLTVDTGFAPVVDRVAAAVVNISSTRTLHTPELVPFLDDPFFRGFFGHGLLAPRERRERSLGSGVIVSRDGHVLTNSHVVREADDIRVVLPDKRELKATIVGRSQDGHRRAPDPGRRFPIAAFQLESHARGEFVLAIDDPLGLGQTVTMGIVSAKGRGNIGIAEYEDFIHGRGHQPRNSGGALVNVEGQLIGINTAIATSAGGTGNQGMGSPCRRTWLAR